MTVSAWPCRTPSDSAAIRAVEIVCGPCPWAIAVCVFRRHCHRFWSCGSTSRRRERWTVDEPERRSGGRRPSTAWRDLGERRAGGCGPSTICLSAPRKLRAQRTSISSLSGLDLWCGMRVDGILRAVPFPQDAPPAGRSSPAIKILGRTEHRGAPVAPGWRRARARVGRAEIDIRIATMPTQAWRERRDSPAAARSRPARSG